MRILTNLAAQESSEVAFEMSKPLNAMRAYVSYREDAAFWHTLKIILFPNDVNQRKWRKELATKYVEINDKTSATNKGNKFPFKLYHSFFESLCSDEAEMQARIKSLLKTLDAEHSQTTVTARGAFSTYKRLQEAIEAVFIDKQKVDYSVVDFIEEIDKVLQ